MSKQDRQGVRTPTDIERKYNLGQIAGSKNDTSKLGIQMSQLKQTVVQYMTETNNELESLKESIDELDSGESEDISAAIIPHILPSGTDFDTVRTPNVYVGAVQLGDGTTANYGNSPSVQAAAFLFEVLPTGATNQVIQRLTLCSKGNSRTFERHYHTSSFGNWYCTYSDGNTLLWSGAEQMDADTVIELTEAISKQPNGVVFVFSYFATDGTVGNYQFQSFFKSKHEIKTHPGGGHQFMLCGSNFNTIATKYFYINDLKITGYAGNIKSGTATTGIIYDNNKYVLRYVIGV